MTRAVTWPAGEDVVVGSLFSGYGGLEQGVAAALLKAGARSVRIAWVSDIDPGAARILAHRYPGVPNLGDITKVDWSTVEPVHILCGGFPCQDVSCAGHRAGLRPDTRSGLLVSDGLRRKRSAAPTGRRGERERTAECPRP